MKYEKVEKRKYTKEEYVAPEAVRNYWCIEKRKYRARVKAKK